MSLPIKLLLKLSPSVLQATAFACFLNFAGVNKWFASYFSSFVTFFIFFALAILVKLISWFIKPLNIYGNPKNHPSENFFYDPVQQKELRFPSLFDIPSKKFSLIVPAWKEAARLPEMMDKTMAYLQRRHSHEPDATYEIIIVDDGSRESDPNDKTGEVALQYVQKYGSDTVRLLTLHRNNGKGGAVQKGMMRARGKYLLMVDADGATEIEDLKQLERFLKSVPAPRNFQIAIGSRASAENNNVKRTAFRTFLMKGFRYLRFFIVGIRIEDTQCGFKLFTRTAAQKLFPVQHLKRWAFDVELLYLAQCKQLPVTEVPVNWQEIDGSKLDPADAIPDMLRDMALVRLCYVTGFWKEEAYAPAGLGDGND